MTEGVEYDTSGLVAAMRVYERAVRRASSDAGYETAVSVASRTRESVPKRSGELAASTSASRVGDESRVSMSAPYAGWIEYGGSRGRPFVSEGRYLGEASKGAEREYARNAEVDLAAAARSIS